MYYMYYEGGCGMYCWWYGGGSGGIILQSSECVEAEILIFNTLCILYIHLFFKSVETDIFIIII